MAEIGLTAGRASARVSTRAGMLRSAELACGDDLIRPLAQAPWAPDPSRGRPGHLDVLGGEFVAVPFGSAGRPDGLPPAWGDVPEAPPEQPHGRSADADWEVAAQDARSVELVLEERATAPIARVVRRVALRADGSGIDFSLRIEARRATAVPIGLHPIFRLPTRPFSLGIDARFRLGYTYPGVVPPGAGAAAPDRTFTRLAAVPGPSGPVDLSVVPLDRPVEDVVLLTGVTGPVVLVADGGHAVELDWDRSALPSVLLWISDLALGGDPWDHRFRGLGVEPVAAAFDLHPDVSVRPNPLSEAGVPTSVALDPEAPLTIRSSIRALCDGH